jgi:hypothetical protein
MAKEKLPPAGEQGPLSHEQQVMWKARHRDKLKSLGPDEKKAFSKRLRQAVEKLAAPDLAKLRIELKAAWDALPAHKKALVQQRFAKKAGK